MTALLLILIVILLAQCLFSVGSNSGSSGVVSWYNHRIADDRAANLVERLQADEVVMISINSCSVSTDALSKVLYNSLYNTSRLSHLSLRHCHLDSHVLSAAVSARVTGNSSTTTTTLLSLDVSHNNCLDSRAIKLIASVVSQASHLTTLDLSGNPLKPEEVRTLVHACRRHPSLTSLSLSSCGLTDASIEYVAFLLKANRNITMLDLSCNVITQQGLENLAGAIRTGAGRFLVSLDLSHNSLGDLGAMTFASAFECNQLGNLKNLSLRDTQAGAAALTSLLGSIQGTSLLESFDISANTLFEFEKTQKAAKGAKKMKELVVKSLSPAVESGMQILRDLGTAVTDAVDGAKSASKRKGQQKKSLAIGYKGRGVLASRGANKREGKGKGKGMGEGKGHRKSQDVDTSLHRKKLLARSRSRALSALLGAVRSAPHLRVLGLVSTGLTDEAGEKLQQLATRAAVSKNGSSNATASSCGISVGLPPVQVLLEMNELSEHGVALVENAVSLVRFQASQGGSRP